MENPVQKITRSLEAITIRWWYLLLLVGVIAISMAPTVG
jgi:hypothetical protein